MAESPDILVTLLLDGERVTELQLRRAPAIGERIGITSADHVAVSTRIFEVDSVEQREGKVFARVRELKP